jgi:arylsulfatase A-like enzyme
MHADNFVGNLACMWLERWTGTDPFFLQIGFPGPHPPYDPTPAALDAYRDRDVPMPHRTTEDLEAQPGALKAMRREHQRMDHDAIVHLESPTDEQLLRQRRHYLANVSMIDSQIGAIRAALAARGVLDNTVILFTSDHGDCLNDHGHSQKWTMYDPSVRVPAIAWGPQHVRSGQVFDGLTSMMDLAPTILELAGLQPPKWMEARSLVPALAEGSYTGRDFAFSEHARDSILAEAGLMTMVTDGTWKLVEYLDPDDGQLFNLANDPYEEHDLWDGPECDGVKQRLLRAIARWRAESEMHTSAWAAAFR